MPLETFWAMMQAFNWNWEKATDPDEYRAGDAGQLELETVAQTNGYWDAYQAYRSFKRYGAPEPHIEDFEQGEG